MKKLIAVSLIIVLLLCGCSAGANAPAGTDAPEGTTEQTKQPAEATTEEPTTEPTEEATPEPTEAPALGKQENKGTLGDFDVEIVSATLDKTYDGNQAVVIEFLWKNNSDKAANFMFAVSPKVFQNGIECETAILDTGSEFDTNAALSDIKTGVEQKVWMAYVLQDKSKIDVEVTELISFDDNTMIVRSFDLE